MEASLTPYRKAIVGNLIFADREEGKESHVEQQGPFVVKNALANSQPQRRERLFVSVLHSLFTTSYGCPLFIADGTLTLIE